MGGLGGAKNPEEPSCGRGREVRVSGMENLSDSGVVREVPGMDPEMSPAGKEREALAEAGVLDLRQGNAGNNKGSHDRDLTPLGLSPVHDRFARNLAMGGFKSIKAAAEDAGLQVKTHRGAIALSRTLQIRGAVRKLLEETVDQWKMTKAEIISYLEEVILMPVGAVNEWDKLASEISFTKNGDKQVKSFSKEKAMEMLVRLNGYNTPEEFRVSADIGISDLIGRVRAGGGKVVLAEPIKPPTLSNHAHQSYQIEEPGGITARDQPEGGCGFGGLDGQPAGTD